MKLEDKDKDLILLNALCNTFEHFKGALLFRKEQTITLEKMVTLVDLKKMKR